MSHQHAFTSSSGCGLPPTWAGAGTDNWRKQYEITHGAFCHVTRRTPRCHPAVETRRVKFVLARDRGYFLFGLNLVQAYGTQEIVLVVIQTRRLKRARGLEILKVVYLQNLRKSELSRHNPRVYPNEGVEGVFHNKGQGSRLIKVCFSPYIRISKCMRRAYLTLFY